MSAEPLDLDTIEARANAAKGAAGLVRVECRCGSQHSELAIAVNEQIRHAPRDTPALVAEVRRLRGALDAADDGLRAVRAAIATAREAAQ